MIDDRSGARHGGAWKRSGVGLLPVLAAWLAAGPLAAQSFGFNIDLGSCRPPTAQEWILVVAVTLVVLVGLFFTLVRVVERSYIHRDRSATLGRQVGIFLSLLCSLGVMAATGYLVTGCMHHQLLLWVIVIAGVTALDGLYTWVMASRD